MSRYTDDQGQGMLVPAILVGIVFAAAFYFTALQIPTVQYVLFCLYLLIRIFGALLVLDFGAIKNLMEILSALANGMNQHLKPNPGAIWDAIQDAAPNPFLIGCALSLVFGAVVALIYLGRRSVSEEKVVKEQKKKTLDQVAKEWGVPPEIFQEKDLVKLATAFAETRKDRNIPPNVIARKISDPEKRMAILHFERVIKFQETFKRVTNPQDVHRIIRENMPKEETPAD